MLKAFKIFSFSDFLCMPSSSWMAPLSHPLSFAWCCFLPSDFSCDVFFRISCSNFEKHKTDRAEWTQFGRGQPRFQRRCPFGALFVPVWRCHSTPIRLVGGGVFLLLLVVFLRFFMYEMIMITRGCSVSKFYIRFRSFRVCNGPPSWASLSCFFCLFVFYHPGR